MSNQFVCSNCFGNPDLKGLLEKISDVQLGTCDFCGKHNAPIYSLASISQKIKDCLLKKYCMDSSATQDIIEIIVSETQCSGLLAHQIKKILNLSNNLMNKKDAYWRLWLYNPSDLEQSFESFVSHITHSRRFILKDEEFTFLQQLSSFFQEHEGFITLLEDNIVLYRARQGTYANFRELLAPPYPYSCTNNRMTPAGIQGSLYLADSPITAIKEVSKILSVGNTFTVATVKVLESLMVLDLSKKVEEVSCFHPDYTMRSFLNGFIKEISKPIDDNAKDYQYVPTQIIAEFLKLHLELDGIIYPSSIYPSGKNYVLFGDYNAPLNRIDLPELKALEFTELKPYQIGPDCTISEFLT